MKTKSEEFLVITPATHSYRGSSGGNLRRCTICKKKQTTGEVKDIDSGKRIAMCSECASKKGF